MEPPVNLSDAVGKLFYAIAAIDKTIRPVECETLINLVGKEGISLNGNEDRIFSIDSNEIIKTFNDMQRANAPALEAFKEFISFKREHDQEFTLGIKKWIWKIADKISYSFCNKNKSEVIMLSTLKSALLE